MMDLSSITAEQMLKWLQFGMIGTALMTFAATMTINAPYGRYSTAKGWGPLLPAKFCWFMMESPNLFIPMAVYLHYATPRCSSNYSNNILMCMFVMHYINRAIIYPLRMARDASPMPLTVAVLAFVFTCWNGLMQALSLGVVNCDTTQEGHPGTLCAHVRPFVCVGGVCGHVCTSTVCTYVPVLRMCVCTY